MSQLKNGAGAGPPGWFNRLSIRLLISAEVLILGSGDEATVGSVPREESA